MDIKSYIQSGKLEQYCFALFNAGLEAEVGKLSSEHPEIKEEIAAIESTIEKLAEINAIRPNVGLRQKILGTLGFPEQLDINNLPPTSRYADHQSWLKTLNHLIPAEPMEDFVMQVIRQDENIAQMLVISKIDVPEEVHDDVNESFFILKGQCTCRVGGQQIILNAGDYLEIPLHINHDVKLNTPYVVAVLQHRLK